jgi:hypothetical protein
MGENARRMIEERFFFARIVEQLEGVYRRVAVADGGARERAS